MDIYTQILIGIAVFVISALLIWFISAFSMKEKTFEEVMEEQRRQQEEDRERSRAGKKVIKRNKKGKHDKVKDKSVPVPEEIVETQKMVQLEIDPQIIEPSGTSVHHRGKKDKPSKSILHNKDDISLVNEKVVEAHHKIVAPKDEVALKKSHEVVEERIEKIQVSTVSAVQSTPKKSKMDHKENLPPKKDELKGNVSNKTKHSDEGTPVSASRLISSVKTSKLSDNEVQTLIEILLNKQGLTPSGPAMTEDSWNKKGQKGDSMSMLKKQLEDKEQALQEEKKVSMNANTRLKDIKSELVSEKSKYTTMEKQLQDKLLRQKNEMDALHARMQKTHEQHVTETNALQARLKQQDQGGDKAVITKLTDEKKIFEDALSMKIKENATLNDKLRNAEKELTSYATKIQVCDSSKKTMDNQIKSYESKIKKLESEQKEVDDLISKRVEEVNQELRKSEAKNASLTSDLDKATGAVSSAQAEVSTLKAKLQELEAHLSDEADSKLQNSERKRQDLEGNLKNLEKQIADLTKNMANKDSDVKRLQQENHTLSTENKSVKEKLQTMPASNGDIHDSEKQLAEKVKEMTELTANLERQKKTVSCMQIQLDTRQSEIDDLQKQLSQQKAKNNELREKNWKAMEALEKAEKSSAEKVDRALKTARESTASGNSELETYDKAVLQRLFPEVKVSEKLQHKDWMSTFEKQALKAKSNNSTNNDRLKNLEAENSELKSSISDESKKYSSLESDNKKLKSEVDNYQSIVSETETKLRQLEKSIDTEEKKWQEKLKQSQAAASKQTPSNEKVKELNSVIAQQENQISEYRKVLASTEISLQNYEKKIASEEQSWQEKLSSSESELKKVQIELNALKTKQTDNQGSKELQAKIICLEKEISESNDKIIVLNKEKETATKDLQADLEKERKKNKELSMNTVKLNGIIKTGHDALTQEQELVRKLQEQLETRSVASGISEAEESEQASNSASKENGTSV